MRIVQFESGGSTGCGVETDGAVFRVPYADSLELIRAGEAGLETARRAAEMGDPVVVDRLVAPLTRPGKMFGSGVNYLSHGDEEEGYTFPDEVVWDFIKLPSAIIGPGAPIVIPPSDDVIGRGPGGAAPLSEFGFAVDYEVEFGVIMGARAKNVDRDQAMAHVFGFTVFNDVGARSVQFHNRQADLAKNFDTFCPMGPCIVTIDELPEWSEVRITSHVNGELRQSATVSQQIGPPPVAIEWLSSIITLEPGDCLMTGTPAGCGTFMKPPRFLEPGDVVTVAATGIGELTNPVIQGTARTRPRSA